MRAIRSTSRCRIHPAGCVTSETLLGLVCAIPSPNGAENSESRKQSRHRSSVEVSEDGSIELNTSRMLPARKHLTMHVRLAQFVQAARTSNGGNSTSGRHAPKLEIPVYCPVREETFVNA